MILLSEVCCGIWHQDVNSTSFESGCELGPPWIGLVCLAHPTDAQLDYDLGNMEAKLVVSVKVTSTCMAGPKVSQQNIAQSMTLPPCFIRPGHLLALLRGPVLMITCTG
ncbi:hypothetical protein QTP70_015941, partial [Hemibagrus guttatus]